MSEGKEELSDGYRARGVKKRAAKATKGVATLERDLAAARERLAALDNTLVLCRRFGMQTADITLVAWLGSQLAELARLKAGRAASAWEEGWNARRLGESVDVNPYAQPGTGEREG